MRTKYYAYKKLTDKTMKSPYFTKAEWTFTAQNMLLRFWNNDIITVLKTPQFSITGEYHFLQALVRPKPAANSTLHWNLPGYWNLPK